MTLQSVGTAAPERARPGRPPSISTQAIVAAALQIGLERVSFRRLAERLGVNVATIYRYVRNRNELLRLAAFQLTLSRRLPDREHAHWSHLARHYGEEMFESFLAEPELLSELLKGSLGPHVEIDVLDQFIGAMARYGFAPDEALALHRAIGTMAVGAAAGINSVRARENAGHSWHVEIRRTLVERADGDLPNVRRAMAAYLEYDEWGWLLGLQQMLAGIATERGEELPPPQGRLAHMIPALRKLNVRSPKSDAPAQSPPRRGRKSKAP